MSLLRSLRPAVGAVSPVAAPPRGLTILFRREPRHDADSFEGYQVLWPDGRPVGTATNAFCRQGQRLLGLGRHLGEQTEKLVQLLCYPLGGLEDALTRLPGCRVRRFYLERSGRGGRLHFMNGAPTTVVFDDAQDDWALLEWIGLSGLSDGQRQWLDLAARPV